MIRSRTASFRLALEARLLFDGAAVATAEATASTPHPTPAQANATGAEAAAHAGDSAANHSAAASHDSALDPALTATDNGHSDAPGAARQEVYFIDANLPDRDTLAAALPSGAEVVWLNSNQDGLAQIEAALHGHSDLAAIHIITHASEGELQLGSTDLNLANIQGQYASALQAIGSHLAANGDVLIYGCNFAEGSVGDATVHALANALSADVAASTNATGEGGDWVLEDQVGAIQATTLAANDWHHDLLLTTTTAAKTTLEDTATTFNVGTSGATGAVTVTAATALHGSVAFTGTTLTYTPGQDYNGSDTISYTLKDSTPLVPAVAVGTVAVTITPVNDAPVVHLPTLSSGQVEDTAVVFSSLLGQAITVSDVDNTTSTVTLSVPQGVLSLGALGLVTITGGANNSSSITLSGAITAINLALDGLTYTPVADYNGPLNLAVTANDGALASTATLALNFAAVADSVPDSASTALNTPVSFNVLANDSFENSGARVTSYSTPAHGTVSVGSTGNATYTPTTGFSGSDSFTYTVTSGGVTETTSVSLTVYIPNYPPTIAAPSTTLAFAEDTALTFSSANGNAISVGDANGDTLTVRLTAEHGTLALAQTTGLVLLSGGAVGSSSVVLQGSVAALNAALAGLVFSPTPDYNGTAGIAISANDGLVTTNSAVALRITPVADGVADTISTSLGLAVTFSPLANDSFASSAVVSAVSQGAHGTVAVGLNNSVAYTPALGYTGTDSFTYTVLSGGVTETVNVSVTVGDHAPTSVSLGNMSTLDGGIVVQTTAQAFQDADALDLLTYSATHLPQGLSIDPLTGVISGVVGTHASVGNGSGGGVYEVVVTATDLAGQRASSTLLVTVSNPLPVPLAGLALGGNENTPLHINVTTLGIVDPDGDSVAVTGATALHGTVTVESDGALNYVPNTNYSGLDTITYQVRDADGGTATGYALVTLAALPHLPNLSLPTLPLLSEDTPLVFANLANLAQLSVGDIDGNLLSLTLSVPLGGLSLSESANVTLAQGTGNMDQVLTITGSAANLTAALAHLVYTPAADYNGLVTIGLDLGQLTGGLLHVTAQLPVTIVAVADIADDTVSTTVGTPASFNVLANDTFEYAGRYVSGFTQPAHGTLSLDAQGNAVYTPASGYVGNDSFTYTVTSDGTTETATVYVNTALPNYPPSISVPVAQTSAEDTALVFSSSNGNALAVADANGDTLTVAVSASHGTFSLGSLSGVALVSGTGSADTSVTLQGSAAAINAALQGAHFNPLPDYNGTAQLSLSASDGQATTRSSVVLTITAVADGVPDTVSTGPLQPVSLYPLANDSFASGASIVAFSQGAHGVVVLGSAGQMTYTPALGYQGNDSFTYTVLSGGVTETVSVSVVVGDHAPTSTGLANVTTVDGGVVAIAAGLAFHDSDALDVLRFSATGLPAGLSIDALTGTVNGIVDTHASVSNNNGGVYTVVVTATDLADQHVSANFQLTVTNPAPIPLVGVSVAGTENNPLNIGLNALGIVDPDGDTVTVSNPIAIHGTVTLAANGDLVYTPESNYYGADVITYTARDSDGGTATGYITVTLAQVYQAPVLSLPSIPLLNEDTPLVFANLANLAQLSVGDIDGNVLSLAVTVPHGLGALSITQTAGVSLAQGTNGNMDQVLTITGSAADITAALAQLVYTPAADYNGNVQLSLDLSQLAGGLLHATAILPITIAPVADIVDDHVSVTQGAATTFDVLANDTFEYSGRYVSSITAPAHGSVAWNADGSMAYTPSAGYLGNDSFTYTVTSDGTTETATVYLTVAAAPNHDPVGQAIPAQQGVDASPFTLDVSGHFSDADGDALTYSATGLPSGLSIDAQTGRVSGTLGGHASTAVTGGLYTVVVAADDGHGGVASQSFSLTVSNPPPVAASATFDGNEGSPVSGALQASDPDGDALAFSIASAPTHGTLSMAADGTFTYTPVAHYHGTDAFTYRVTDADGGVATASVTINLAAVNEAPAAVGTLPAQTSSDAASFVLNTAAQFSDADGDTLTYSATGLPSGLAIDARTGVVSGTLDGHASVSGPYGNGLYNVVVTATDPSGASAAQAFDLTVNNPPPTTASVAVQATEGTPYNGQLQASDPDGDTLSFSTVAAPTHGSLSLAADGSFTYTPNAYYNGVDTFTYQVRDADGGVATATVTLNIAAVNDPPSVATPIPAQTGNDGASVSLPAGNYFTDVDGDTLSYSAAGLPGGLSIDAQTGLISGTLASSASTQSPTQDGHYSVTVTANDGHGGLASQTFTFDVSNPLPTTAGGSFTLAEDTPLAASLSANDPDGDTLTFSATRLPAHGSLVLNADGTFTYTPVANYNGSDSFTYRVRDADGGIASGTVLLNVTPVNDAPVVVAPVADQNAVDSAPFSLSLAGHFSDVDGDTLSYSASGLPAGLQLNAQTGLLSGVLGTSASQGGDYHDGRYGITVSAADGQGGVASQTFTLVVTNPPPETRDASFSLDQGSSVAAVLAASDPDGDTLTFSPTTQPAHGTLALNADGSFTYTPAAAFSGSDSFTYQVRDADGGIANATVTFTVAAVNHPPVVGTPLGTQQANDSDTLHIEVASHFSDPDGGPLTYSAAGLPTGVSIDPVTGVISGTLAHDASSAGNGQYSIVVAATDSQGASTSLAFVLQVANPLPLTGDSTFSGAEGTVISGQLQATDPDGDSLAFSATRPPAHGSLVLNADGSFTYTPAANYNGTDSFTYQVRDSDGGIATASVALVVQPVNAAPTSTPVGTQTAADGSPVQLNLSAYFSDADNDALSYRSTALPAGLALDASTGIISGTLGGHASTGSQNLDGQYSITITADDGHGGSTSQTFLFIATNPPPVASDVTVSGNEGTTLAGNLANSASDPDGDTLTFSAATQPAHGTLTLNTNGSFTYVPAAYFHGTDSFTYQVADADGGTTTATVTLAVNAVNDPPQLVSALGQVNANDSAAVVIDLASHFSDPDGDALNYRVTGLPAALNYNPATGLISGTLGASDSQGGPARDGQYSVTVSVDDGHGGSITSTFVLAVSNPPPTTVGSSITLNAGSSASGTLLANDPDGDTLAFTLVPGQAPANGRLALAADGTYTYTPNPGFTGQDSFQYQVTDADGAVTPATLVLIAVEANTTAPGVASQVGNQAANDSALLNLELAQHFVDNNNSGLVFSASGDLPAGISLDANTGLLSGMLGSSASQGGAHNDGQYSITITATDANGAGAVSQSFVLVVSNPAPLASNVAYSLAEDGALSAQLSARDPDGDTLAFSAVAAPAHGTLALNADGSFNYVPNANFSGQDSFTYQVRDADGAVATAVVSLVVTPVNHPPVVTAPLGTLQADDSTALNLNVGATFSDADRDVLTFSTSSTLPPGLTFDTATGVLSGTLGSSASQGGDNQDGRYTLTITASDGHGGTAQQVFTLVVSNPAPVSAGGSAMVQAGQVYSGQLQASDPDGDSLAFAPAANGGPGHGTVVLNPDGSYTYTPAAGYSGSDSFSYTVRDSDGGTTLATVSISVTPGAPPVATSPIGGQGASDGSTVAIDTGSHFSSLGASPLAYTASGLPAGLSIDPASGLISGTLANNASTQGENGSYSVSVIATDGYGGSAAQSFILAVTNPAPQTAGSALNATAGVALAGTLAASDPDGDALAFTPLTPPAHGTLVVNADGSFSYTPAANYQGRDSFTYQVRDADGGVAQATVAITVSAAPSTPPLDGRATTAARLGGGEPGVLVFHRDANYTPVLLDAVNGVKRLEGLNVLSGDAPLSQVANAMGRGSHTELAADAPPVGQAVGDLNEASRTPLDVATLQQGPFGTHAPVATDTAPAAGGAQAPAEAPAPAPVPEQAQVPTLGQQLQAATQQRQFEMDALRKALLG